MLEKIFLLMLLLFCLLILALVIVSLAGTIYMFLSLIIEKVKEVKENVKSN